MSGNELAATFGLCKIYFRPSTDIQLVEEKPYFIKYQVMD